MAKIILLSITLVLVVPVRNWEQMLSKKSIGVIVFKEESGNELLMAAALEYMGIGDGAGGVGGTDCTGTEDSYQFRSHKPAQCREDERLVATAFVVT